ncbi:unnamed protein product [Ectocarpus sp. 13 AM-2016]
MVAPKSPTNSLLLTNQQTGTVQPGESVQVSFSFHATSVGRWTHDLAVRNLGNKHDQAKVTVSATVKPRMYLHFPDLDPNAKGKPEKLQIGFCYMPGLVSTGGGGRPRVGDRPAPSSAQRERPRAVPYVHAQP